MSLVTSRCILRAPTGADAGSLAKHANNRKIWLNVRDMFPHPYTVPDAQKWIARVASEEPRHSFVIEADGEAAGGIGLKRGADVERMTAEVGYWLGEEFWGRGVATEAVKAITEYGFATLELVRIFAVPLANNAASSRVLEKAGYEKECVMRNACIKDGKILDMSLYARIK